MGQIENTCRQEESNKIIIIMKSRNSAVAMKVDEFETMGKIAFRYCMKDAPF